MKDFNIGDRVVAVAPVGRLHATGVRGRVVGHDDWGEDSEYLAVEFDEDIGGTNISDISYEDDTYECPDGHGWFVLPGDIERAVSFGEFELPTADGLF